MSNYCIEISKKNRELFLKIWRKFEKEISNFKNVIINNNSENLRLEFEIAVANQNEIKSNVDLWIADSIVVYFKSKFIEQNLRLMQLKKDIIKAFSCILASFDKLTDIEYVLKNLKFNNIINIDSFYIFKLGELRLRWEEVCNLIESSSFELGKANAYLDLMRHLIALTEPSIKVAYIFCDSSFIYIKDGEGINIIDPIKKTKDGETAILLELITLSPSSIVIRYSKNDLSVYKTIENLFDSKVVYCT